MSDAVIVRHIVQHIRQRDMRDIMRAGRMQLAKAVMNGDDISDLFRTRINQCLLCGSCSEHCPPGVHIPEIAERLRCALNENVRPDRRRRTDA